MTCARGGSHLKRLQSAVSVQTRRLQWDWGLPRRSLHISYVLVSDLKFLAVVM